MKKFLKIAGIVLLVILVAIAGLITYVKTALPNVGDPPELKVEATPEMIERGKYLANSVAGCTDCHSTRDWTKFSGPLVPGTIGKGGERFDQSVGFPGVYFSRNITPAGIGRYSDGELYRVITTGVTKEGRAMFPVMPYLYYGKMDDEDIYSIIAYLRSLPPVENNVPESESDFPMSVILNTIPKPGTPTKRPDPIDKVAYGKYLVNAAGCIECHTQVESGQIKPELAFSGGRDFNFPDRSIVRSSNITPDPETGIGKWTEEQFVQRFRMYADTSYVAPAVNPGEFNTIMPWTVYGKMTEQDLAAIFAYMQTVTPIKNQVIKFAPRLAAN
ncbi:MAG TPA: c-type cytochrome [Chryseosolibacter sp.]|nr:c-type cytochrome [Chryseosolibacter sp.]